MLQPLRDQFLRSFDGISCRTIFVPWLFDTAPTETQVQACWKTLNLSACPIVIVNRHTLESWIHPEYPLPASFHKLNVSQASDFIGCYLMHLYGGAITSPSVFEERWDQSFERLEQGSSLAILLGKHFGGSISMVCRRSTQLTENWHSLSTDEIIASEVSPGNQPSRNLSDTFATKILESLIAKFEQDIIK
jgi:hypothetical protein